MTSKQFILSDINTWDSPDTCTRVTYKVSALWFFGEWDIAASASLNNLAKQTTANSEWDKRKRPLYSHVQENKDKTNIQFFCSLLFQEQKKIKQD